MTTICLEDPADVGFFSADGSCAISEPAKSMARQFHEVERRFLETWAGRAYQEAINDLRSAAAEASSDDWDGYGSRAVSLRSVRQALRFLKHIPSGLPAPHVSIDPDGEVSFEWRPAPHRAFSISIGENGSLTYAALFGKNSRQHGTEAYFADRPPAEIHSAICRVFSA